MIGAASVANRQRLHAEVLERFHPRLEDRRHRLVALQVDATNQAGAVIDVEVAGELRMLRLQLHRRRIAVVRLDVFLRAEQPLLLTAPQADAHGAAQLDAADLQQSHRLHHDGRSGGVVGRAGPGVP